jgi:hypothetical protein
MANPVPSYPPLQPVLFLLRHGFPANWESPNGPAVKALLSERSSDAIPIRDLLLQHGAGIGSNSLLLMTVFHVGR